MVVKDGQALPPCCASCGAVTDRRERISRRIRLRPPSARLPSGLIALLLFHFFRWALGVDRERVSVDLPRCAMCSASSLQPDRVDFENGTMTFVVDKSFRDALAKAGQ